jgi:hypothetical protein
VKIMQIKKNRSMIGAVDALAQAERVVNSLQASGFQRDDISVLVPKHGSSKVQNEGDALNLSEHLTKAPEGAAVGVAGGGFVGGAIGLLAGIGALAIPGVGPFIAAGPIMATLSGAAAGAALGGIAGALIGLGFPESEAKKYEGRLKGGQILLAVRIEDDNEERNARSILVREGAHDVGATGETAMPAPHVDARHV